MSDIDRGKQDATADRARRYLDRGWRLVPIAPRHKKPNGWPEGDPRRRWSEIADQITPETVEQYFGHGENVGVVLDPPLADVDLDSPEAVALASRFLRPTPFYFGRAGAITHFIYDAAGAVAETFADPCAGDEGSKAMLVEIRAGNGYTLMPPSIHPSGERLTFGANAGWPEAVLAEDLRGRVAALAATALLVRHWPGPGARNEATMALCGGLVRAEREKRITPELVEVIVRAVVEEGGNADAASDFELLDRTRKLLDKIASGAQKKQPKGWASLEKLIGDRGQTVVRAFRDWLGVAPASWSRRDRGAPSPLSSAPWADRIAWEVVGDGERVPQRCADNVAVILACDPALRCIADGDEEGDGPPIAYLDEFRGSKMVRAPLPWEVRAESANGRYPRQWADHDLLELQAYVNRAWGLYVGKDMASDGADLHAGRHREHEVQQYLRGLTWDGVRRLDAMGARYFGVADDEYARIFRLWMISAVARALDPGCQADHVIILEGPQGIGKSTALRRLAVHDDWFADPVVDMQSKAGAEVIRGAWIVELAELNSLRRADVEQAKAFITRREDKYRPAYGRETVRVPRSCVFAGTVNVGAGGYLADPTGNRRFWPIACEAIDLDGIERDCDQLWAEAADAYQMGEQWHPTADMEERIQREQRLRAADQGFEAQLLGWLEERFRAEPADEIVFTVAEALVEACGMSGRDVNERRHTTALGNTCQAMGFRKVGRRPYDVSVSAGDETDQFGLPRPAHRSAKHKSVAYVARRSELFAGLLGADGDEGDAMAGGSGTKAEHLEDESVPF